MIMEVEVQDELKRLRLELSLITKVKPFIRLKSSDGTVWKVIVNDLGELQTIKEN